MAIIANTVHLTLWEVGTHAKGHVVLVHSTYQQAAAWKSVQHG